MDSYCTENMPVSLAIAQSIRENKIDEVKVRIAAHPQILKCNTYSIEQGILHFSVALGRFDICKLLVAAGVDVDASNDDGEVPLNIAATKGHLEIATWLVDSGADIDGNPAGIQSPLMDAITFGHVAIASLLIERRADLNRMNSRLHTTALDLAMTWGQPDIERLLRSKSAPSTLDQIDWEKEFGGPILRFIDEQFGKVLPIQQYQVIGQASVGQRIALVNKNRNKLLFTVGLFNIHDPMLELFIVLPANWNMHIKTEANQFPSMLLRRIANQVAEGLKIEEGLLITADDPNYANLAWPPSIAGFCVCDNYWGGKESGDSAIPPEDRVRLWTLLPIKRGKGEIPKQSLEKCRTAGWTKLTLQIDD
jgi:hypothetical protein